jgi:hypothetical protein
MPPVNVVWFGFSCGALQISVMPFDAIGSIANSSSMDKLHVLRIVRLLRLIKLIRIAKASR